MCLESVCSIIKAIQIEVNPLKTKTIITYFLKLALCWIAFLIGMICSNRLAWAMGFTAPGILNGTDVKTSVLWFLFGSTLLSFAARILQANWFFRWAILAELVWIPIAVWILIGTFFSRNYDVLISLVNALHMLFHVLIPSVLLSGAMSVLFKSGQPDNLDLKNLRARFQYHHRTRAPGKSIVFQNDIRSRAGY